MTIDSRRPRRPGFTIVEVLVVTGILGLLVGLLLPALGGVRRRAARANEVSNLRQIGYAWTAYANQNHGALLPGYLSVAAQEKWSTSYRYPDGTKIPPAPDYLSETYDDGTTSNIAGPWTWRLLPLLDNDLGVVLDHDDEIDASDVAAKDSAWSVRNTPAFGYNAMFVGGWWDKSGTMRYQRGLEYDPVAGEAVAGRSVRPVSRSLSSVRRASELMIFTSSAVRNPGIHKYDAGLDDQAGSHVVLPPILTRYDLWGVPNAIGAAGGETSQGKTLSASLGGSNAIQIYGSDEWFGTTAPFG